MKAAAKNGDGSFTRYGTWSSKANSRGNESEKAAGVALVTSVRLYLMRWLRYLGFFQEHGWVETHMALGNKEFSMIQHFLLQGTGERCSRETRRETHAHEEKSVAGFQCLVHCGPHGDSKETDTMWSAELNSQCVRISSSGISWNSLWNVLLCFTKLCNQMKDQH